MHVFYMYMCRLVWPACTSVATDNNYGLSIIFGISFQSIVFEDSKIPCSILYPLCVFNFENKGTLYMYFTCIAIVHCMHEVFTVNLPAL